MRPQGFLGRSFAQQHAAQLGLPSDTALWSDDQTLLALAASGDDCVGNLLLGERAVAYPRLAALALAGESVGSSAR